MTYSTYSTLLDPNWEIAVHKAAWWRYSSHIVLVGNLKFLWSLSSVPSIPNSSSLDANKTAGNISYGVSSSMYIERRTESKTDSKNLLFLALFAFCVITFCFYTLCSVPAKIQIFCLYTLFSVAAKIQMLTTSCQILTLIHPLFVKSLGH